MHVFALSSTQLSVGQFALAAILAFLGVFFLLPRPKGRSIWEGIVALAAAAVVFGIWLQSTYGNPMPDLLGSVLFWLFSAGALVFGTVLVVQRNPARGAIAFAFVILSTCGLFLLLAAPFLMAATIIIYAGAIIVTFLFVLMLSHPKGESNENDRTREPLLGTLAGFSFVSLVLFTLYLTYVGRGDENAPYATRNPQHLPAPVLTDEERKTIAEAIARLDETDEQLSGDLKSRRNERIDFFDALKKNISRVVGDPQDEARETRQEGLLRARLKKEPGKKEPGKLGDGSVLYRDDPQMLGVIARADKIRKMNWDVHERLENFVLSQKGNPEEIRNEYHHLRDELVLLNGSAELPGRNVENLGFILYADHLLAIEMAGTLLLVATIGAVAIAQKRGVPE